MEKWQVTGLIASVGGVLAHWLGGWDMMLQVLIGVVMLDYVTGVLAAAYNCRLSSSIGYKGILKKVGLFVVVLVSCMVSNIIDNDIIRSITMVFYISNEGISILENVGRMGVAYPKKLRDMLAQLNKEDSEVKHSNECKCDLSNGKTCECSKNKIL